MAKTAKKSAVSAAFAKRLKTANKAWAAAKEKVAEGGAGFGDWEDGKYMARLIKGTIGTSNADRLQVDWEFRIEEGKREDDIKHDYQGLETEQNLEHLGRRLVQLGYEIPDDLSDITDILADVAKTKPLCSIRIKTNGDFQNVYIDKVFGEDEEVDADEDTEEEETDDTDAEEEADDEAEEEEEEAPAKKKAAKKTAKKKAEEEEEEEEEEEAEEEEADEEDESEEEDVELEKGMAVIASTTKGEKKGKVIEVLEDEGKVRVKLEDGKTIRIDAAKLSVEQDEDEEEEVPEEPPAKKKKTAKK